MLIQKKDSKIAVRYRSIITFLPKKGGRGGWFSSLFFCRHYFIFLFFFLILHFFYYPQRSSQGPPLARQGVVSLVFFFFFFFLRDLFFIQQLDKFLTITSMGSHVHLPQPSKARGSSGFSIQHLVHYVSKLAHLYRPLVLVLRALCAYSIFCKNFNFSQFLLEKFFITIGTFGSVQYQIEPTFIF